MSPLFGITEKPVPKFSLKHLLYGQVVPTTYFYHIKAMSASYTFLINSSRCTFSSCVPSFMYFLCVTA